MPFQYALFWQSMAYYNLQGFVFLCYRLILFISLWFIRKHLTSYQWQERCRGLFLQIIKKREFYYIVLQNLKVRKREQRVAIRKSITQVYCCRMCAWTHTNSQNKERFKYRKHVTTFSTWGHTDWYTHFNLISTWNESAMFISHDHTEWYGARMTIIPLEDYTSILLSLYYWGIIYIKCNLKSTAQYTYMCIYVRNYYQIKK